MLLRSQNVIFKGAVEVSSCTGHRQQTTLTVTVLTSAVTLQVPNIPTENHRKPQLLRVLSYHSTAELHFLGQYENRRHCKQLMVAI